LGPGQAHIALSHRHTLSIAPGERVALVLVARVRDDENSNRLQKRFDECRLAGPVRTGNDY
jgi:hypothetical protein